jgi:hypothetical protein
MARSFAQTNIQLYNQMLQGGYRASEIERVADAYELATGIFSGLYRGSGKPLLCHLVGTASIVAWCRRPVTGVAGALLHAALADGDFGRSDPHVRLAQAAGRDVERIVVYYHDMGWSYDSGTVDELVARATDLDELEREAVIIRIANEVEDYLDLATHYHGRATDGPSVKKSAAWRLRYMESIEEPLKKLATSLGQTELTEEISAQFGAVREAEVPSELRSGRPSMWFRGPPSYRRSLGGWWRLLRTRLARIRRLGVRGSCEAVIRRLRS